MLGKSSVLEKKADEVRDRSRAETERPAAGAWSPACDVTCLVAAALGNSGDVAAGLKDFGGLCVALPCASAKRSRLLLEVFDDCLCGPMLSPRDGAIITETIDVVLVQASEDGRYY